MHNNNFEKSVCEGPNKTRTMEKKSSDTRQYPTVINKKYQNISKQFYQDFYSLQEVKVVKSIYVFAGNIIKIGKRVNNILPHTTIIRTMAIFPQN